MIRIIFLIAVFVVIFFNVTVGLFYPTVWWSMVVLGPLIAIGFIDMIQIRHTIRRNFPVIGNLRYFMELVRPEINQYFVESNTEGTPFSREDRSVVYQRAKKDVDTIPFGTLKNVYETGYEWVNHSLAPVHVKPEDLRVMVGGPNCTQPYSASVLNVGAMSFGAISKNAVLALNQGAKMGHFAHNTGEGGLSQYHLQSGGDVIWQIGTGYFSCRTKDGKFCETQFAEKSKHPHVKMVEIKLSQGAKPSHGGILPAAKVSKEISKIRGVPLGVDCISPPAHSAFTTPFEFVQFIAKLRDLSGGKPIGFKICIGKRREFIALCKAMIKTGITPDFIEVDGGEGGTGAAPLEFSNYVGCPLTEALIFVQNCLVGFSLRKKIRIISSGKITTAFGMIKRMTMGADLCYSTRGMMLSLGCIQALKCNTNHCPVGLTTQDPQLVVGLVVEEKNKRVYNYHRNTIKILSELLGAMGLKHTQELRPWHVMRRVGLSEIRNYSELYQFLHEGDLLKEPLPSSFDRACRIASPDTFAHV